MEYAYQNSTIAQILEAILGQGSFDGDTSSDIAEILLSILYATPYTKEPKSTIADLLIRLKAKIEGDSFEPYDGPYEGQIAEIIISILTESEYTKAPRSRIAELFLALKAEIESYAEVTVSGAIANFTTSLKKPLVNLAAIFQATQESGTPTPQDPKAINGISAVKFTHTKKNLYNYDASKIKTGETTAQSIRAYLDLGLRGPNQFTISANIKDGETSTNTNINIAKIRTDGLIEVLLVFILTGNPTPTTRTVTINQGERLIFTMASDNPNTALVNIPKYDYQIEVGAVESDIEPYDGAETIVNLGGTYYGGELSQDKNGKRKLKVTRGYSTIQDLSFRRSNNQGQWDNYLFYAVTDRKTAYTEPIRCNKYQWVNATIAHLENECLGAPTWSESQWIYIRDDNYTDVESFISGNSDLIIEYELAEPFEIDLPDGSPIIANVGVNNIYNDAGDTSVTYLTTISDNIRKAVNFKATKEALKKQKELEKELEIKEPEIPEKKEEPRK